MDILLRSKLFFGRMPEKNRALVLSKIPKTRKKSNSNEKSVIDNHFWFSYFPNFNCFSFRSPTTNSVNIEILKKNQKQLKIQIFRTFESNSEYILNR
jgi:hypothetical protein